MAMFADLSREERIGLGAAVVAHAALAVALAVHATRDPPPFVPTERIDVSLIGEVSLESTAPDPSAEPAAAMAPKIADTPQEEQEMVEAPAPEVIERPVTTPPRPTTQPRTPAATPTPQPTRRAETRPTPAPTPSATASQRAQGSRLNDDFLQGTSDSTGDSGSAAQRPGPAVQRSIDSEIIRQLKPHWNPPSGVDVDQLVTVVRFQLNRDGSLRGNPEVLRTDGQNSTNRTQVGRHQEQAVRAVRLAAPFNLPEQYYSGWRVITSNFDNRLAQ